MIDVLATVQRHLAAVESCMHAALASDEVQVEGLIASLGSFHGKMLRPALVLLVADAAGGITPLHHRLGAALEMIHTATLIHDDLIDDATTRRGRTTAHVALGNTTSVLLGDYFYTHAFAVVAEAGDAALMRRLTVTTNIMCTGELHQQCASRNTALSEEEYNRIIYAKTAALCQLAGEFGAAGATPPLAQAGGAYARACGMAFQIVDDCLDFAGDPQKVGKTLATDIERGRLTLPIIRILETAGADRPALEARLLRVEGPEDVAAIRALVIDRGGVAAALATARSYVVQAQAELAALPPGPARERLADLARFIVERTF